MQDQEISVIFDLISLLNLSISINIFRALKNCRLQFCFTFERPECLKFPADTAKFAESDAEEGKGRGRGLGKIRCKVHLETEHVVFDLVGRSSEFTHFDRLIGRPVGIFVARKGQT